MNITYATAKAADVELIYNLSKQHIDDYENIENIDYEKVLCWVRKKIETHIDEYVLISVDEAKAGIYHFFKNEDDMYEIDDLYIFPEFQNKGIGSTIINKCCSEVNEPVMLYVFSKNTRAVSLYKRLGFEITKNINNSRYIMINRR